MSNQHHHDDCNHEACDCHRHHQAKEVIKYKQKIYIKGLDCANCAAKIEATIQNKPYVNDASLDLARGILYVDFKESVDLNALCEEIKTMEDGIEVHFEALKTQYKITINDYLYLIIAACLFILGIGLKQNVILFIAYVIAGHRVILKAIKNIKKGDIFDENLLMMIASLGAIFIHEYSEAIAVMLFYEVGELLQSFALNRSRNEITSLMDLKVEEITVIKNDKEVIKKVEDVKVKEIMVVKAGERIALDGTIVKGASSIDTSTLTGESMPIEVHVYDEVMAGCLNLNGLLHVKVNKVYEDSSVSKILELVEHASSRKAKIETFISKFAKIYTPIVVFSAFLIFLLLPMINPLVTMHDALKSACVFLIVSCPCALVISIPLALFAGIGHASSKGILIKGGNYLEALNDVEVLVCDKTGTLTKGNFHVSEVIGSEEVLKYAAYGEYYSNHPMAACILKAYNQIVKTKKIKNYQELSGYGVSYEYEQDQILVGNKKLMINNNVDYLSIHEGSVVYVAKNKQYLGCIVVEDEIKTTSKKAIQQLKQMGIKKVVMLSGDQESVGRKVADALNIDEIHMQLLPQDKVHQLEIIKQQTTKKVLYVGDGINDAPVLAISDIAVSMGNLGSDAAIEASDIVLMYDDLNSLCDAMKIAKKTKKIMLQNIVFALGVKFLVMVLAILSIANMWLGVFADVGVSLLAILNSLRVKR